MKRKSFSVILVLLLGQMSFAQPATEYESLFKRFQGWTGADGTYSIGLSEDKNLWGFSDTFFGRVKEGRRLRPFRFVNNSLVLQQDSKLTFLKAPVFQPPDRIGWFWLFDGVFNTGSPGEKSFSVEFLLGQFRSSGEVGAFGFEQCGLWWSKLHFFKDGKMAKVQYEKLPYFQQDDKGLVTFGSAITELGPWYYVYGIKQDKQGRGSVLARVPREQLGLAGAWRFFDGQTWQTRAEKAEALFQGASVEYSVYRAQNGSFVYLASGENGMSRSIVYRTAPSPQGPWSEPQQLASAPEHSGTVFCYNAKAHPQITQEDKVLVSYNVNTMDLKEVVDNADIYRPRFLWWKPKDRGLLPLNSGI